MQLLSKTEFYKLCGGSANSIKGYMRKDPDAPKIYHTPIGERFDKSEVLKWLTSKDSSLRNLFLVGSNEDKKTDSDAATAIAIAKAKGKGH